MRMLSAMLIAALLLTAGQAIGQTDPADLTKEQRKEWKKIAKKYKKNPAALAELTSERDEYYQQANQLETQIGQLEMETERLQNQVTQLEQTNAQLNQDLMAARETAQMMEEEAEMMAARGQESMGQDMSGTVYRVQIGAFQKSRAPESVATAENMALEEADGMQKVMVGHFRSFDEAKALMTYLQSSGVEGAWVVPYVDGQRVSLKEALGTQQ